MLTRLKLALAALTSKTYHFVAEKNAKPPYIVWREEGSVDLTADNDHAEAGFRGAVDLFTRDGQDPLLEQIPATLQNLGLCWYLEMVQYEADSGLIHYTWAWEGC